ncbi:MAG: hypothetical protein IPO63_07845 [Bacteroidetes bacterium]|nr:hypothetical protein [Bacteroidota bacterium]
MELELTLNDKIKETLKKVHEETHKGTKKWTHAFVKKLGNLGSKNGLNIILIKNMGNG